LDQLVKLSVKNISKTSRNTFPNGLVCLKGVDLRPELGRVKRPMIEVPLSDWFHDEYFKEKELVYVEL
ncbi:MAG: 16S rRNA (guanine(527)-N(7))-methyltransferase RsmG, partial [Duncaniella sp.]|nr:16S rRNA (guanine(527)-N(7))-methyltransferase RsmG [Duncaniella sp.]